MRLRNIRRADETIEHHFAAIHEPYIKKGKWNVVFENENPLHIEIGMGKGQFLLTLASRNPDINYVGIERYSSVLLRALEKYDLDEYNQLTNIRFICMDARNLADAFDKGEVKRIYLNFSDPWPKVRHAKRRLTSKEFFQCYQQILDRSGVVEFKTDNTSLFQFSLEQVEEAGWKLRAKTFDLHHDETLCKGNVMTEYETKFSSLGHSIHKLIASQE
ncbi:MAG: tRNA (guanosine(46)-N7)-methyltransferase TrmB [Lachnospiraceae bacterium]